MSTEQVIEQIKLISRPDDLDRVGKALEDHRIELMGDLEAARRVRELQAGAVQPLNHEQVFGFVRNRVRED